MFDTQDVEVLVEEIQEARRIKRLHQPSKVPYCCLRKGLNLIISLVGFAPTFNYN